jgi:hypothetical protein
MTKLFYDLYKHNEMSKKKKTKTDFKLSPVAEESEDNYSKLL